MISVRLRPGEEYKRRHAMTQVREPARWTRLARRLIDEGDLTGARNAIRVCLDIQPHERVTVITDAACAHIARALENEIHGVGAPCTTCDVGRPRRRSSSSIDGRSSWISE